MQQNNTCDWAVVSFQYNTEYVNLIYTQIM